MCKAYENKHMHIIHISSGITRGRVLNAELYAQRLQKLIYLHLSTDCRMTVNTYRRPYSPS